VITRLAGNKLFASFVAYWLERLLAKHGRLDSLLGHTKDFKNDICCFSCFNAQHLRVAQIIETVSGLYVSERNINSFLAL